MFWVEKITADGKVILSRYDLKSRKTIALKDVSVWPALNNKADPIANIYFYTPDLEVIFLEKGFAKLNRTVGSSEAYRAAQAKAKDAKIGWWAAPSGSPPLESLPPPTSSVEWLPLIALWGGIGTFLGSLGWVISKAIKFFRRRKIPILFLGTGGVGKSWIWIKMVNPDADLDELKKIGVSDAVREAKAQIPENFGKYLLTPVYIDTPGRMAGEQAQQLFKRKRVWLIVLAPTADDSITPSSPDPQKIDREYVARQLGYLTLPLGLLASKKIPKPTLVIIVFAKFDLFSVSAPDKPDSGEAKVLINEILRDHKAAIEHECNSAKIPVLTEFCSAREGWRTEGLMRQIKRSLFS